jgi:hypothetical protein
MADKRSPFSAAEQGLGYIYQARFALLMILSLPESNSILLEKEDDVEFTAESGVKSLGSLKHKAVGDALTDLSTDFWKSVRIWLSHYVENGRISSDTKFLLFTTAEVSSSSFLKLFVDELADDGEARLTAARSVLETSQSQIISSIRDELGQLTEQELQDFYSRITIVDGSPRITAIPQLVIDQHLRTVRRESRSFLFERLEGWWMDLLIKVLSGERKEAIFGYEISDKLSALAEEYRSDNLPITFRNRLPGGIDVANDPRLFVEQLRVLELSATSIQNAIIDYYRAFEQRSSWARESLLISGEIEEYENRLVDEWTRYREVILEGIDDSAEDEVCISAGKELYRWAELETSSLRIRERVTEPYIVRGTFHILANARPSPQVYWHPRFLKRLGEILGAAA